MSVAPADLLEPTRRIAEDAGKAVMRAYKAGFTVDRKEDDSPVTAADAAAHDVIVRALSALTPDLPIVSEEEELKRWDRRRQWERYWLLDPLDGTREFIRRNGQFSVNIALIEDSRPVLGVVHAPTDGRSWFGGPQTGAFRQTADGSRTPLHTVPADQPPYRVVLGRSRPGPRIRALLESLPEHRVLQCGASIKICLIAEGEADLFPRLGPISEWDLAAAQAILEAAGGQVLNLKDLSPLRYNQRDTLTLRDVLAVADPSGDWWQHLDAHAAAK